MMYIDDIIIRLLLMIKLNGFRELSEIIIQFRNDLEFEGIKKEYIEKDFCNWLNQSLLLLHFVWCCLITWSLYACCIASINTGTSSIAICIDISPSVYSVDV